VMTPWMEGPPGGGAVCGWKICHGWKWGTPLMEGRRGGDAARKNSLAPWIECATHAPWMECARFMGEARWGRRLRRHGGGATV
jgi:hypothetical protein